MEDEFKRNATCIEQLESLFDESDVNKLSKDEKIQRQYILEMLDGIVDRHGDSI